MKAKYIHSVLNEANLVSKFRKGMRVDTADNSYYIKKVEDHNNKFDLIYVVDKNEKSKIVSSEWLEQNGTILVNKRNTTSSKYPSMTTREYVRTLKDAIDGLQQTGNDTEDPHSYIYDSAESMIYDESLYNYLYKKYKKLYDTPPRLKRDLIELLSNDISKQYYQ